MIKSNRMIIKIDTKCYFYINCISYTLIWVWIRKTVITVAFFIIEMQTKQRKRLLIYAGIGFIITGIVSLLLIYKLMY